MYSLWVKISIALGSIMNAYEISSFSLRDLTYTMIRPGQFQKHKVSWLPDKVEHTWTASPR